ncbi:Collectin-12 [Mactra antiquata]
MDLRIFKLLLLLQVPFVFCNCRDGFQRHGEKCYYFSQDVEPFAGAQVICDQFNGHLTEMLTPGEITYVNSQVKLKHNGYYWIGLTDLLEQDIWTWITSEVNLDQTVSHWAPNEPSSDGAQFCVVVSPNGNWHDGHCSDKFHYVCEYRDENTAIVG